jgi:hypothetical protein
MTEQKTSKEPLNRARVVLSLVYLLVALFLIFLFWRDML